MRSVCASWLVIIGSYLAQLRVIPDRSPARDFFLRLPLLRNLAFNSGNSCPVCRCLGAAGGSGVVIVAYKTAGGT